MCCPWRFWLKRICQGKRPWQIWWKSQLQAEQVLSEEGMALQWNNQPFLYLQRGWVQGTFHCCGFWHAIGKWHMGNALHRNQMLCRFAGIWSWDCPWQRILRNLWKRGTQHIWPHICGWFLVMFLWKHWQLWQSWNYCQKMQPTNW